MEILTCHRGEVVVVAVVEGRLAFQECVRLLVVAAAEVEGVEGVVDHQSLCLA